MAVCSMTGYGYGQAGDQVVVTVEMRSVNQRYSDFSIRLPREYNFLEETVRRIATSRVRRGRVEISVTIEDFREKARTVKIDWGLLQGFDRAISEVAQRLELEPTNRVDFLLSLPGVLEPVAVDEEDEELLQSLVEAAAQEAVEALVEMRKAEGARLAAALLEHLALLEEGLAEVKALAESLPQEALARLETRIAELVGDMPIDPNRLAAEAAIIADRANVDEEIVRLASHLVEFRATLEKDEPMGRKLDFLIQEMNREVNTIGSKSNNVAVSRWVVEAKTVIEKL
ncbi:MAG: YicC family protein, partial [Firmicutes bacterium]|nr:YicC family protein [Bacillota bacterium]